MPSQHLLIPEHPLMILPSLAVMIGLNEAIAVQQIHFLLIGKHSGVEINGHKWIWNTYEQWQEEVFPFWSVNTIQRVFAKLESMFLVESLQPDGFASRRKYYRLNKGMIEKLIYSNLPPSPQNGVLGLPSPQNGMIDHTKMVSSCAGASNTKTETTAETTISQVEKIYAEYPKKIGKADALKKIQIALKKRSFETLMAAVKAYAVVRKNQDQVYTCNPATWFHQGRYDDDQEVWKSQKQHETNQRPSSGSAQNSRNDNVNKNRVGQYAGLGDAGLVRDPQ